jgi:cytochrome c551/c552
MLENSIKKVLFVLTLLSTLLSAKESGTLLFHGNCITCHFETKALSAPSMQEIRQNYKRAFSKKEDFVEYMSSWVEHPKREGSLMLEAVNKYSLMPELGFDKSSLEIITSYIYDTDFTKKHEHY